MEASAIQASPALGRPRITLGTPLLRLRSDHQLVTLFREGNEDAFRIIHDRYRPRLQAYIRQMLPGRAADVEDALQDVFLRAYSALRTSNRELALRPWLYRVAHNRCIDELRRPVALPELQVPGDRLSDCDPVAETERRETLRRLVIDIERLPDQQRSALMMRELSGMAYADVAAALSISVPAVKSLLVRARIGLTQAVAARDAACLDIRSELAKAHEDGVRASWMARRHLRDCEGCRACRAEMRIQRRQLAALAPTFGPLAVLAKLFGVGTGAGGGSATAAGAGGATVAGASGTITAASGLATVTVGHVATILAAAVVTAGGAVAVQQTVAHSSPAAKHAVHAAPTASTDEATAVATRVLVVRPAPPAAPAKISPAHHTLAGGSASITGSARWHGRAIHPPPAPVEAAEATPSAATPACTPPPPPPTACTASQTSTCSTSSNTGTPSGTTTATGTTTTGTSTTPTTGTGTTSGTTSGTPTGTGSSTCQTTTQPTGTQATQPGSTGATGTTQPSKPL